jgi:hypothetical protein
MRKGRAALWVALGLFLATVVAGLFGFGWIPSSVLFYARMVFFVAGTLALAALLVGLARA